MPEFKSLVSEGLTFSEGVTCDAYFQSGEDELWDRCVKPSRYVVERSDGDTSFGSHEGTEEFCEEHLTDAVCGMVDGDERVRAVVTIRWTKYEDKAVSANA